MKHASILILISGLSACLSGWALAGDMCVKSPASCPEMERCVPADCRADRDAACFNRVVNAFSRYRDSVAGGRCISDAAESKAISDVNPPVLSPDPQKLPSLHYGNGIEGYKEKAVVIVHGSYGVPGFMDDFVKRYADAGYNVVNCRLSGHGQRDEDLKKASYEDWQVDVQYCYDIATRLGREVELLGHSVGASLVSDLAIREAETHPDDNPISHMHLLDPPIRFRGGVRWLGLRPGTGVLCKPVESGSLELMSDLGFSRQSDESRMRRYREYVPDSCTHESVPPYNRQQYLKPLCEIRKLMLHHPMREAGVAIPTSIFISGDMVFSSVFTVPTMGWLERHLGPEVSVHRLSDSVHALMTIEACNGSFDEMWNMIVEADS